MRKDKHLYSFCVASLLGMAGWGHYQKHLAQQAPTAPPPPTQDPIAVQSPQRSPTSQCQEGAVVQDPNTKKLSYCTGGQLYPITPPKQ